MSYIRDTIAAISTPIGFGGIGVVRVSGGEAFQIVSTISSIEEPESHRAYHTWLIDDLDEVIITFFKSPKSYTGEDVVEISCHGSPFILQKVLELLIKGGAREGLKGEFTKRAFLNEKLDLLQAEGVLSLINSQTDIGADISAYNLRGGLSSKITELKNRGINLLTKLQAATDFPDDLDHFPNIKEEGAELLSSVSDVIKTARYGKLAVCGVKTVIVGKPNVGKSSLLNLLLKEDRAIVTEIPGTTRDVVSENINIKGALFSLYDTAGIRESNDLVEMAGIDLAEKHIDIADLILVVLDSSKPLDDMDNLVLEKTKSKERIIVLNKADLLFSPDLNTFRTSLTLPILDIIFLKS